MWADTLLILFISICTALLGEVLLMGYLFHYVPFFFYDRTLFVHHYLPAYLYKIMLTSALISHLYEITSSKYVQLLACLALSLWLGVSVRIFYQFSTLSFGQYPLTSDEVKALRWKDTWDLIIHKP